jgi:tRNA pseudouridine55 synthase
MSIDGILNVRKPVGSSSFSVVRQARRWTGQRRVGHGGTLDPLASGVLLLLLGHATRFAEFLGGHHKSYRGEIALGVSTTTYDAEGEVLQWRHVPPLTEDEVRDCLKGFLGEIQQVPPSFSALHYQGRRSYQWAREGRPVPARPRTVHIFRLELVAWRPPVLEIGVECSRGTYIRSLAHDVGECLGCGGHLQNLVRTQDGPFTLEGAVTLEQLQAAVEHGTWTQLVHPVDGILAAFPAITLDEAAERAFLQGQALPADLEPAGFTSDTPWWRAYNRQGRFLGLLQIEPSQGKLLPRKVLSQGR